MQYGKRKIYKAFDGKLVGNFRMKQMVCNVLINMPDEVISYITENCWFMGSMKNSFAYVFKGNDLKNQSLVFLGDELFFQIDSQIKYTIAHEIGHVYLNHNNSTKHKQSKKEINRQELEADKFAKKYLI